MTPWSMATQVRTPARLAVEDGACVVASRDPSLVLAGDWCTESSFEGCAVSAQAAADAVRAAIAASDKAPAATAITEGVAPEEARTKPTSGPQREARGGKRQRGGRVSTGWAGDKTTS